MYRFTVMGKALDQCDTESLQDEYRLALLSDLTERSGFDDLRIAAIRAEIIKRVCPTSPESLF